MMVRMMASRTGQAMYFLYEGESMRAEQKLSSDEKAAMQKSGNAGDDARAHTQSFIGVCLFYGWLLTRFIWIWIMHGAGRYTRWMGRLFLVVAMDRCVCVRAEPAVD